MPQAARQARASEGDTQPLVPPRGGAGGGGLARVDAAPRRPIRLKGALRRLQAPAGRPQQEKAVGEGVGAWQRSGWVWLFARGQQTSVQVLQSAGPAACVLMPEPEVAAGGTASQPDFSPLPLSVSLSVQSQTVLFGYVLQSISVPCIKRSLNPSPLSWRAPPQRQQRKQLTPSLASHSSLLLNFWCRAACNVPHVGTLKYLSKVLLHHRSGGCA